MRTNRILHENEIPGKVAMPSSGYDASLCPKCAGDGTVNDTRAEPRTGWLLRRHKCKECGYKWHTVELYVTFKHSGPAPNGSTNTRYLALEVDALGEAEMGPCLMSGNAAKEGKQ